MSDLIRKSDVLAVIDRCKDRLQGSGLTYEVLKGMIDDLPTVNPYTIERRSLSHCDDYMLCRKDLKSVTEKDYCSRAERRK